MSEKKGKEDTRSYFPADPKKVFAKLGASVLLEDLEKMLLARNLDVRGESAYQHGLVGGFYHAYIGQEAIQTALVRAMGPNNWYTTTYRCHCLALLLGVSPHEIMAELYGRSTGNALGRGGSMHLYSDRLLGGFGIVGGQIPIGAGAGFSLKYQGIKDQVSVCFLGDGAVATGAFHETLNSASLWDLPCVFVIENNLWGMGTPIEKAVAVSRLAEDKASGYNIKGYSVDGMDYFACYSCFSHVFNEVLKTSRPVLVEAVTERFRGHSISDPALYRSKEMLVEVMKRDPITALYHFLEREKVLDEALFKEMDKKCRLIVREAMDYAEASPWPDPATLEEDVFAP